MVRGKFSDYTLFVILTKFTICRNCISSGISTIKSCNRSTTDDRKSIWICINYVWKFYWSFDNHRRSLIQVDTSFKFVALDNSFFADPALSKNKENGSQPVWKFICSGTVQLKRSSFGVFIQCRWPKLWQIPWAAINQKQDQRLNLTSDMRNKWKSKTIWSLFCCVEWYLFKFYPSMPGPKVPLWSLFLAQIPSSIILSILVLLPVPYIHRGLLVLY